MNARSLAPALLLLAGCTIAGTTSALAYYRRARQYAHNHDFDRAIAYYDTTLMLFARPLAGEVYVDRGIAYSWKGMTQRAIADYDTSLSIYPDGPRALASRGAAYLDLDQPSRALTDLTAALRLDPGITWARHRRARAWAALDSFPRAIADLDTVLAVWTDRPDVAAERARFVLRVRQ